MSEPLRICFVSQLAYRLFDPSCPAPFGGAELQMYLLATELASSVEWDVHFVTQDFGQPNRQDRDGITVWRYSRPFKGNRMLALVRWLVVAISTLLTLLTIRADVYVESPGGYATWVTGIAARLRRARFVYWMASDADIDGALIQKGVERRLFLSGITRADGVIAQNRYQQSGLLARHEVTASVIRIAFPVPTEPPLATKDPILWVASAQELKQPWLFLELARAFPEEHFVMIMPSNDVELFESIQSQAGDISNLEFSDGVPYHAVQAYFDRARVFVNTSTIEGFPNTFIQSAMGATPVLSLNINPDQVLTSYGFGRVSDGNMDRLRSDLAELLADEALRERMGAAGFEYARKHHDISAIATQFTEELYRLRGNAFPIHT